MDSNPRRDFLKRTALALPIIAADVAGEADATAEDGAQPESFWRDRMTDPDDGKKYGWFVDTRRCFGCHACEVSCKSENDVPLGHYIRQTIYRDIGEFPEVARVFLPMSCQHCEDAPCIKACPCGALPLDPQHASLFPVQQYQLQSWLFQDSESDVGAEGVIGNPDLESLFTLMPVVDIVGLRAK